MRIISGAAREGARVQVRDRGGALDRLRIKISLRKVYVTTDRMNKAYTVPRKLIWWFNAMVDWSKFCLISLDYKSGFLTAMVMTLIWNSSFSAEVDHCLTMVDQ